MAAAPAGSAALSYGTCTCGTGGIPDLPRSPGSELNAFRTFLAVL